MSRARLISALWLPGALLLARPGSAPAWSGDPWGSISRSTIKALADAMIDATWSPKNTFTNFQYGSTYRTYYQGTNYTGVAYSQNNPQENLAEFLNAVTNTAGGSVGYGNDCSGFVSICWKLPARKTTALFESQLGTYWVSLGDFGSAATAPLLMGDALNAPSDHIVLFLNHESTGIRTMEQTPNNAQRRIRSYSFLQTYRPIRRLLITDAPGIVSDGLSRVVDAGKSVSLRIEAAGAAPLAFQWFFNGEKLNGASNNVLTLNPARLSDAGDYFCVVSNAYGMATSRVVSLTVFPPQVTVLLDTFDGDTSADWQISRTSADTRVTFAWDYSALGIPPAPNATGGTTRGLRMEANLSAGAAAALSLSPRNRAFAGDFRLRFDMWLNANGPFPAGGAGSTEHLTAGVGTRGDRVHWTGSGSSADGCWFAVDGEGGASDTSTTIGDFCAFLGTALQNTSTGVYLAGTESNAKGNVHPYYAAAFGGGRAPPAWQQANYPQQTGTLAAGTVGFAWREVIVARRGNRVDWAIDGVHLASFTNATLPGSNVFIGYWDSYASLSDNPDLSFGLVDNVRVEVPVVAPLITAHPQSQTVKVGTNVTFTVSATGTPPPAYQWRFNGLDLAGATNAALTLTNVQAEHAGVYSVLVTNAGGALLSSNATLTVLPPLPPQCFAAALLPDGRIQFTGRGEPGRYTIESSTNLTEWEVFGIVVSPDGFFEWNAMLGDAPQRFFRARWSP